MKSATNFDDDASLKHPENQVFAVFENAGAAARAAEALNQAGFPPEIVGALEGAAGAAKLAEATGEKGLLSKLSHLGVDFGDQDRPYLEQYKAELEQGHAVLAVVTKDDDQVARAQAVLAQAGGRFLTKFGKWAFEALESGRRVRDPQA